MPTLLGDLKDFVFFSFLFYSCYCPLAIVGRKAKNLLYLKHRSTLKEEENTANQNAATVFHILQKSSLNENICSQKVKYSNPEH